VPAGLRPSRWNSPATYSAALRWPALPVSRPSSLSSAKARTCDHHRRPSGSSAPLVETVATAAIANAPIHTCLIGGSEWILSVVHGEYRPWDARLQEVLSTLAGG